MGENFSIEGLEASLDDLREEYKDLYNTERNLPKYVIDAGYAQAKQAFGSVRLDGPLDERPTVEKVQYGYSDWSLEINGDNVDWFEYGTGIVGQRNPHPEASMNNYEYDVNNHGSKGWWYKNAGSRVHTWGIQGAYGIYKAKLAMELAIARGSRGSRGK